MGLNFADLIKELFWTRASYKARVCFLMFLLIDCLIIAVICFLIGCEIYNKYFLKCM